jgi:Rrf2 family iron-sulfur cluster assembly transcriptional regulator
MAGILSKSCDYGIRAALYVALQEPGEFVSIKKIAEDLNISFHFLTKILQQLTKKHILTSYRGPNGGVTLSKKATTITLEEIVIAIDGDNLFQKCILGLSQCQENAQCPIHGQWKKIRKEIRNLFGSTTLSMLTERITKDGFRIKDSLK